MARLTVANAPSVLRRLALTLAQLSLLLFAWWGILTIVAEIGRADPAYAFLRVVLVFIALALTLAAALLVLRLWTTGSASLLQAAALAMIPVLIACTMVWLRPEHPYTQRPFQMLIDMVKR
jgi:hypothetical protein